MELESNNSNKNINMIEKIIVVRAASGERRAETKDKKQEKNDSQALTSVMSSTLVITYSQSTLRAHS